MGDMVVLESRDVSNLKNTYKKQNKKPNNSKMETKPGVEYPRTCTAHGGLSLQGSVELFRSPIRDIRTHGVGAPSHLEMEGGVGIHGALFL